MKCSPGSFSKNFAWHGTGLRKLHTVIRTGFSEDLAPVAREEFRDRSGLDASLALIPVNFFLHNRAGMMSVDELIFQSIKRAHSTRFDSLALFALHLNRVGTGRAVVERPIMWAKEFVHEQLWHQGVWRSSALQTANLDSFIDDRVQALPSVREKCRNNYRHLFTLCGFLPAALPIINPRSEQWIASALFLAWDRYILDGGEGTRESLVAFVEADEIHKLLGASKELSVARADEFANLYLSQGGLDRFPKSQDARSTTRSAPEMPEEGGLEWLDHEVMDKTVERRAVERLEQRRDRTKVTKLKQIYQNSCQFCGIRLQVSEGHYYSEVAHIKGLGNPHDGPDNTANMLVLCPNHHLQFDRGALRLQKAGNGYRIMSKADEDRLHGRKITLVHPLDDECVRYHRQWFGSR